MKQKLKFEEFIIKNRKYYIADFKLEKDEKNIPHAHDFYEFFVVMQGEFLEKINSQEYMLEKRSVHFIKPTDIHCMVGENKNKSNILRNIAVEKNFFENIIKEIGYDNTQQFFSPFELDETNYEIYKNKTNLLLQLEHSEEIYLFLIKSIISDLLIFSLLNNSSCNKIPKWLQNVYNEMCIKENYIASISYMIELSGKSQEHFTREFKKYYGITPSVFLNNLRLQESALLLRTSNLKIIDIVYECGFDNVSYFNRLFKLKFGVTPREYRDSNKKIFNISI